MTWKTNLQKKLNPNNMAGTVGDLPMVPAFFCVLASFMRHTVCVPLQRAKFAFFEARHIFACLAMSTALGALRLDIL